MSPVALSPQGKSQLESAGGPTDALRRSAERANSSLLKRSVDVAGAAGLLLFLFPTFCLIALLVKLDSHGPVFFRQERYGKSGKPFAMFKFRSMTCMESSGTFVQASANDSRVTRIGRLLRATSIDELPQLINVLRGEMSLVGPRPHAIAMDDHFASIIPNYSSRYLVRPGLTGLAQISGHRGPTVGHDSMNRRLRRDLAYVRRWSFQQDIKVLFGTPLALMGPNAL
jgi:putative colanic acid biosynthesis UDP-glucose lipid carrier transferase